MSHKTYEVKVYSDGTQEWYLNGNRHREDGPAIIWADGTQVWYINDNRHREDGPAVIRADGTQEWYLNGKLHREDGPARIWANGTKEWWVNGKNLTEQEFNQRKQSCTGKIVTIDGKQYKLTEV